MTPIYLITPDTIRQFEDISINVKPERIQVFIKKAQELDLKPFMGAAFYYDLLRQFDSDGALLDSASPAYQDLINGCDYTDRQGHTLTYEGLAATLVYFTFARYIEADSIHYTATGPVTKKSDNSDAVRPSDIVKLVQQQRSVANAHANEISTFLFNRKSDFPLWQYSAKNATARQSGPRIRSVDRTDFNTDYNTQYPYTKGII